MRFIGLDVHRDFCEVAISDGDKARSAGRIDTSPSALQLFADSLARTDRVVLESTSNALAIAKIFEPHVAEVVLANSMQVRAICRLRRPETRRGGYALELPISKQFTPTQIDSLRDFLH
jgi:transposase